MSAATHVKSNEEPSITISQQPCPFTVEMLLRDRSGHKELTRSASVPSESSTETRSTDQAVTKTNPGTNTPDDFGHLLPASYRDESNHVATPARHVTDWLNKELDLSRLSQVQSLLWFAGLPLPPRPLHYQLLMGRDIVISEQLDMHLVWTEGRIFIKPLPRYLLDQRFWTKYLSCESTCGCEATPGRPRSKCEIKIRRERATGFLFSYTALLSHESDFLIAEEKHLLPRGIEWSNWRTLVDQLHPEEIHQQIDPRFYHGELRLSRLNKLYTFWNTPGNGYLAHWDSYNAFFRDNFSLLATLTIYMALVLTAMQVGLGTDLLAQNSAFVSASYGFTIFCILGPIVFAGAIFGMFAIMYAFNWISTRKFYGREVGWIRQRALPKQP